MLAQNQLGMLYVRVYTSPITGKTMFDAMHKKGYRMLCEVVPGQPADSIEQAIMLNMSRERQGDFEALKPEVESMVKVFARAAAGGRGMIAQTMIGPESIKENWEAARLLEFLDKHKFVKDMDLQELEAGLKLHYGV